jgi:hypothetical protein
LSVLGPARGLRRLVAKIDGREGPKRGLARLTSESISDVGRGCVVSGGRCRVTSDVNIEPFYPYFQRSPSISALYNSHFDESDLTHTLLEDWHVTMSTVRLSLARVLPRLIRLRDAAFYLGMDKNRFNCVVRPHVTQVRIGVQGIAFDRRELDRFADY